MSNPPQQHGLSPELLARLLVPYDLNPHELQFLGYSQNYVYACQRDGGKCILRISHGRYRTKDQVAAELDWIQDLNSRGVKVCPPIPARSGEWCVESVVDGERYLAACFVHAPGGPIASSEVRDWHRHKLGRLLGQLHAESAGFTAVGKTSTRPYWYESRLLREDLVHQQAHLSRRFCDSVEDLIQQLRHLPRSETTYGLLHGDVSFKNCHLHEGELWIFDFDNCEQGYFLQDIATVLYDTIYCRALNKFADPTLNARMAPVWKCFWAGYLAVNPLQRISAPDLQRFFLLREAVIYLHYHRTLDLCGLNNSFRAGLEVMRSNVERQVHQVDFAALVNATPLS